MDPKYKRFASWGLYLTGLALVMAVGLYILQRTASLPVLISLGVAVLGLAANILLDPEGARSAFTGRQAKYGSNAIILSIAFIGIVILANFLVYKNDKRWDLTEDQENSLAPETIDALAKLPEPVVAKAFYTQRNTTLSTGENLLKLYEQNSDGKFTYEVVDPEADPIAAQQAGVTRDGDVILVMGDRMEKVSYVDEQEMSGALVRLMSTGTRTVYFTTGHGEYNPDESGTRSYSQIKGTLENKNYVVKTINLLTVDSLPTDTSAVVVAGPSKPLTENEVKVLKDYVSSGGRLIVMNDPSVLTEGAGLADPLLDYLALDIGIKVNDDVIIDLVGQQQLGQPLLAVGASYGSHAITQGLGNYATVFPQARSLTLQDSSTGGQPVGIVFTQSQSWGETDLAGLTEGNQANPDDGVDNMGPLTLMAALEGSATGGRVVVIGDADFVADDYVTAYGNSDLFVNTLDWAVGQENLITLTPKATTTRTLNLPAVPYLTGLIVLIAIIVLPGSMLATGIGVAISRKRRG
jgi:ABC-type uncharacterized transport system involved in gliding motility auxiliary subunit